MSGLLEEYSKKGLEVHHISMEDGCVPGFSVLLEAVFRVQEVIPDDTDMVTNP